MKTSLLSIVTLFAISFLFPSCSGKNLNKEATFALKMYELHGSVKTCKVFSSLKEETSTLENKGILVLDLEFSKDGLLTRKGQHSYEYNPDGSFKQGCCKDDNNLAPKLKINDLGQIYAEEVKPKEGTYSEMMYETKYHFDINGTITQEETIFAEGASKVMYESNDNGLRMKETFSIEDYDCTNDHVVVYQYIQFDDNGNWTKRIKENSITTTDENGNISKQTENGIEIREIQYY